MITSKIPSSLMNSLHSNLDTLRHTRPVMTLSDMIQYILSAPHAYLYWDCDKNLAFNLHESMGLSDKPAIQYYGKGSLPKVISVGDYFTIRKSLETINPQVVSRYIDIAELVRALMSSNTLPIASTAQLSYQRVVLFNWALGIYSGTELTRTRFLEDAHPYKSVNDALVNLHLVRQELDTDNSWIVRYVDVSVLKEATE